MLCKSYQPAHPFMDSQAAFSRNKETGALPRRDIGQRPPAINAMARFVERAALRSVARISTGRGSGSLAPRAQ